MIALLTVALYWTLLYRGVSLILFTAATAGVILVFLTTGAIGTLGLVVLAVVVGVPLALSSSVALRTTLLTRRLYGLFRRIPPEMGETEKQALEAGDV